MPINLPISEDYTDPHGQFIGYDCEAGIYNDVASGVINTTLSNQYHVDIRGFVPSGIVLKPGLMLNLDTQTQAQLDLQTQGQLEAFDTYGDNWTGPSVVKPIPDLNNNIGLVVTISPSVTAVSSTLAAVDLTGFNPNNPISLSMPGISASSVTVSDPHSFLSLSDGVNTCKLLFSQSTTNITNTGVATWPYSMLTVFKPTTITISFSVSNFDQVYITGLRILGDNWQPLGLDTNTQGQFLRPILTPSGNIPLNPYPMAWRSDTPPGQNDPRPIDSDMGVVLYTGSLQGNSTIDMYARGRREAVINQLDLQYVATVSGHLGFTQGDLDNLGHQPDFGESLYDPRDQADLDTFKQSQLDGQQQWQLERISDTINISYLHTQLNTFGSNLFTNPGFELNTLVPWTTTPINFLTAGGTATRALNGHLNSHCMQVNAPNISRGVEYPFTKNFQSGVQYNITLFLKGNVGGEGITLKFGTGGDSATQNYTISNSWPGIGSSYTISWTPASNHSNATLAVMNQNASSITFFVDDLTLKDPGAAGAFTASITNLRKNNTNIYNYSGTGLQPHTYYFFDTNLHANTARIKLTQMSNFGTLTNNVVMDSGDLPNTLFRRTAGRNGWNVNLADGDAFVKSISTQRLLYAEYISKPFTSRTPVSGAQLTVSASPNISLFPADHTLAIPYNSGTLAINQAIANSDDGSVQVTGNLGQGIQLTPFNITDFAQFEIKFDLYVPSATLNAAPPIFLLFNSFGYPKELFIGQIQPDSWATYTIPFKEFSMLLTGAYSFVGISMAPNTTWYIDNLDISQRILGYAARSTFQDPWNATPIPWVDFNDILNDPSNGVVLSPRGNNLQLRMRAFAQNAIIDKVFLKPQYSQLGNFTFNA